MFFYTPESRVKPYARITGTFAQVLLNKLLKNDSIKNHTPESRVKPYARVTGKNVLLYARVTGTFAQNRSESCKLTLRFVNFKENSV